MIYLAISLFFSIYSLFTYLFIYSLFHFSIHLFIFIFSYYFLSPINTEKVSYQNAPEMNVSKPCSPFSVSVLMSFVLCSVFFAFCPSVNDVCMFVIITVIALPPPLLTPLAPPKHSNYGGEKQGPLL